MDDDLLNISYKDAVEQLDRILGDLEAGKVDIDQLESTMERARSLLAYCQEKLRRIEGRIEDKSTS